MPVPASQLPKLTETQLHNFGDWTGGGDTKVVASQLAKRGLVGASDMIQDTPDISSARGVTSASSDWKAAEIQRMLSAARMMGLKTPQEVAANREVLIGKGRYAEGLRHPTFNQIHPNFWQVFDGILGEQYTKEKNGAFAAAPATAATLDTKIAVKNADKVLAAVRTALRK